MPPFYDVNGHDSNGKATQNQAKEKELEFTKNQLVKVLENSQSIRASKNSPAE